MRNSQPTTSKLETAMSYLPGVLKHMGFDSLRPGQDRVVFNLFAGRDTFCVLPTGSGKSACYIVPTLCCQYRTLIFSPLIALMKDQVESLWRMGLKGGQISSGQTLAENNAVISQWEAGELQFLLVAPERMKNERFMFAMNHVRPDMVVIDEAHCMSQWSDSFRPDYAKIGDFIEKFIPKSVLALTATAPKDVEEDIRRLLGIEDAPKVVYYPERSNLHLSSVTYDSEVQLLRWINDIDGCGIVYCSTVKLTEELYSSIGHHIKGGSLVYNGSMTPDERDTNQTMFMNGKIRVMFATNAFGLGIDKPDIRFVAHRTVPGSVDALAQEIGRAGRDGKDSWCRLFFDPKSYDTQMWFIKNAFPEKHQVQAVFRVLQSHADADGICKLTVNDIGKKAGVPGMLAGSAIGILNSHGVVSRTAESSNLIQVRIVKPHMSEEVSGMQEAIKRVGILNPDNQVYDLDLDHLMAQTGLKAKKAKDLLKMLDKEGYINYTPPFRGKPTKIIGDIGMVDFARLKEKYQESVAKLDKVINYVDTPDEKKHAFFQRYFGITKEQT